MYLKSIDIVGYKSFALKTHLDLEPGITGIIGPNGCGKSNIMESVRWCLGEMSWKSLRADSMVDVIFSGTAKRQPLSMTEVTLTFDNASNMLPVQFSEVTISRRIFRSGESAYFLNKTQCRLRDIREMFLDTGLGGDGYAIIDQGGVEAMISAKPDERRAFFEEAAGVAKYNAKREEALRKLERVEMDMGRLQDSVTLIDEQVKKLDSDARKANLFKKYKEELVAVEAAHILQQVGALQNELEALAARIAPLEETLGAKRTEMNAEGANVAALNLRKAGQQNQIIAVNGRIAEVKNEIGRLEERIRSSESSIAEAGQRAAACRQELDSTAQRLESLAPEFERAAAETAQASAGRQAAQQESDGWSGQLDASKQKLRTAEAELEDLRKVALDAAETALALRRKSSESESAWSRQEMQIRSSLRDLEKDSATSSRAQEDLACARAEFERRKEAQTAARAELDAAESELARCRQAFSALSEETLRLHADLARTKAKAESLEVQGGQNPYWVGAQAVLNAGIEGIVGTVRQLIKIDDEVKPQLEDALGERLYAVVCEDSAAAKAAVELLEASGKGRARLLVLSSLPEAAACRAYPQEARPLMARLQITEPRYERAVRFLLEENYELDAALFSDHWVYGGSSQAAVSTVNLADIHEVRAAVSASEARREELSQEKSLLEAELAQADARARQASLAFSELAADLRACETQIVEKESTLSLCSRNAELSVAEAARTLAEMAVIKEEVAALRGQIESSARQESQARQRESEAALDLGKVKEELARGESTQELLKSKLQGWMDKLALLASARDRLASERKALEAASSLRTQEIADLSERQAQNRVLIEESKSRLETLSGQLAVLENEAKGVFEQMQDIEQAVSQKEAALRALRELCEASQQQLHELQIQVSGQRGTQDALKKRLWDEWQLTHDEAKAKYKDQEVDAERIDFLRKRITALGNVNMAAPEEYLALSEKQVFLANQIHDLNNAKEDLKAAIQKINGATRENFRQTFTDVREHFRKLYGTLFEGGEADLVLTDPENFLETGVDIVAQPPGKRLQSISLLSGGEKTLTAIALLFAFFMVKPSPFCMLDEADAALDDANIERFVALLREFQSRSQFLIVSHNKRTMEAADIIYGVTMEELGVSQLVSVDFRSKAAGGPPAEVSSPSAVQGPFAA